mgnify:CR=1 FL=1|jgi:hypothetical protein
MAILDTKELFDDTGCIPVWGHTSGSGKPYYTFQLTSKDKYIFFPSTSTNPKAPKFQLRKVDSEKTGAEE